MLDRKFSTSEVLQSTGITARQLQWWDERGIVKAGRQGRCRIYSAEDLIEILVIEELRRRGISLQQVRRVLRFLREEVHLRLAEMVQDRQEHHLLLDDSHIYLISGPHEIVDLMRNARQPMLLVSLSDAVTRLNVNLGEVLARTSTGEEGKPSARKGAAAA